MKRKILYYIVKAELPEDVSEQDFRAYMQDAVESWSGAYHPCHPLFARANRRVFVRRGRRREPT